MTPNYLEYWTAPEDEIPKYFKANIHVEYDFDKGELQVSAECDDVQVAYNMEHPEPSSQHLAGYAQEAAHALQKALKRREVAGVLQGDEA